MDWPASYIWSALQYRRGYSGPSAWMGSLIFESRDANGLYYRRNRYYDSEKGRFTQEDPIGLAGGVNVYGFANGDPVAYSDPYGLSALCKPPTAECIVGARFRGVWAALGERANAARRGLLVLSGNVPYRGDANDGGTVLTGRDVLANEDVGLGGRIAAGIGIIAPVGGGHAISRGGDRLLALIRGHVGDEARAFLNGAGDLVVQSKDELREVRFDIKHPDPHQSPHVHVIGYERVKNRKVEVRNDRVYPNDVPPN